MKLSIFDGIASVIEHKKSIEIFQSDNEELYEALEWVETFNDSVLMTYQLFEHLNDKGLSGKLNDISESFEFLIGKAIDEYIAKTSRPGKPEIELVKKFAFITEQFPVKNRIETFDVIAVAIGVYILLRWDRLIKYEVAEKKEQLEKYNKRKLEKKSNENNIKKRRLKLKKKSQPVLATHIDTLSVDQDNSIDDAIWAAEEFLEGDGAWTEDDGSPVMTRLSSEKLSPFSELLDVKKLTSESNFFSLLGKLVLTSFEEYDVESVHPHILIALKEEYAIYEHAKKISNMPRKAPRKDRPLKMAITKIMEILSKKEIKPTLKHVLDVITALCDEKYSFVMGGKSVAIDRKCFEECGVDFLEWDAQKNELEYYEDGQGLNIKKGALEKIIQRINNQ